MHHFLKTEAEIIAWLHQVGIGHYHISPHSEYGFEVSCRLVDVRRKNLTSIPVKFGRVGAFYCSFNDLTSLEGAPDKVTGDFVCDHNQLTSLRGAPQFVGDLFSCRYNKLKNLEFAPSTVNQSFYCDNNSITSLQGAPTMVMGSFDCGDNQLTSLEHAPYSVGIRFDCERNSLRNLLFLPSKVGYKFLCSGNPDLGGVQNIVNFKEIYEYHLVEKEKLELNTLIESSPIKKEMKSYKI